MTISGRARWVVAATATLALVGGGVYVALPASAATTIADGFEGTPYDRWTPDSRRGFTYAELVNDAPARTGSNTAYLEAYPPSRFSARISRSVTLTAPSGPEWCYAEAFLWRVTLSARQPDGSVKDIRPEMPRVTLQVHTGGIFGPVVGGASYDLPPLQQNWGRASFASFARIAGDYTIDISVTSGGVTVDDVTISCVPEIE